MAKSCQRLLSEVATLHQFIEYLLAKIPRQHGEIWIPIYVLQSPPSCQPWCFTKLEHTIDHRSHDYLTDSGHAEFHQRRAATWRRPLRLPEDIGTAAGQRVQQPFEAAALGELHTVQFILVDHLAFLPWASTAHDDRSSSYAGAKPNHCLESMDGYTISQSMEWTQSCIFEAPASSSWRCHGSLASISGVTTTRHSFLLSSPPSCIVKIK